jgi:hypothetical protein
MNKKKHKGNTKHCARCNLWKGLTSYHKNKCNWDSLHAFCKDCMSQLSSIRYEKHKERLLLQAKEYRKTNLRSRKNTTLKYKYGITIDKYESLVRQQKNACAICTKETGVLHVDHCHRSKEVRGLLCIKCNTAIGSLNDCKKTLLSAIKYLEQSK